MANKMTAEAFERLPDCALLTRRQVHELSSFALVTLKLWAKQGRGPRITVVEGRPRHRVGDVRAWMNGQAVKSDGSIFE